VVETLGIIIDRCPKGRPRKRESQTIEKIGCVVILIYLSLLKPFVYKGFRPPSGMPF